MPHLKKQITVLLLLVVALIGSILIFQGRIQSTSRDLGYGPVDKNLNLIQKMRYSIQMFMAREALVAQSKPPYLDQSLVIQAGESVQSICGHLNSLIPYLNSKLCRNYLVYRGLDRKLEPGTYSISGGMPAYQVFQFIANPLNRDRILRIYPGWRVEEIAAAIDTLGLPQVAAPLLLPLLQSAPTEIAISPHLEAGQSLEGYLLPGDYLLRPGVNPEELVQILTKPILDLILTGELQSKGQLQGLGLRQILTLASIIQRETLKTEEMPRMASVFYNRLSQGMPLQTDPTVQYAIGYDATSASWWKPLLSISDLAINSIYNTYQVTGLPPGPIASPSLEAIEAVLNPENTEFLFFRAKCDGSGLHDFSLSYQEHLEKACP